MSQLKVNSIVPVAGAPTGGGGGIIQVKQTLKNDTASSSTTTSFTDISGLSVSITPTSSSSKILLFVVNGGVFYENAQTVSSDYTITSGNNAMAAGDITISSGVTVVVSANSNLTIV